MTHGYDGDDESGASSCSLQQYIRPFPDGLSSAERCGLPWTTPSSERFIVYSVPRSHYNYVEDLEIPPKRHGTRNCSRRALVLGNIVKDYVGGRALCKSSGETSGGPELSHQLIREIPDESVPDFSVQT